MHASPTTTIERLDAETRQMMGDSLDRFINTAYEPSARLHRLHARPIDYRACWPTLAEVGVLAVPVAPEQGGVSGSAQDVADMLFTLARGLLLEPLIESGVIATSLLQAMPGHAALLEQTLGGERLWVVAGGHPGDSLQLTQKQDGFVLDGTARVVPGAAHADGWLLIAHDEAGQPAIVWVETQNLPSQAVQRHDFQLMDGRHASDLVLQALSLPASALGLQGDAAAQALVGVAVQAVNAYCADAAGAMHMLVAITRDYLRTREQFGVPLSSFQALQHRLADMHMAALEARAISRELARCIDQGDAARSAWLSHAAPLVIARCSQRIGHDAIQLHGGMGVTEELVVGHYNARLVVLGKLLARWMPASGTGDPALAAAA